MSPLNLGRDALKSGMHSQENTPDYENDRRNSIKSANGVFNDEKGPLKKSRLEKSKFAQQEETEPLRLFLVPPIEDGPS